MRVLISAFAFSPYKGSECAVGWNICKELAKLHDVTVLFGDVQGDRRSLHDFERYCGCRSGVFDVDGIHAVYVPAGRVISLIERIHHYPGLWMLYYLAYNLWQRKAYRVAKRLCREQGYDIVHQLNMIGYREPGYMWKLGIPFVWGPVGGGSNEPFAFRSFFSWSGGVRVFARTVCNEIQKRFNWRARHAARLASKIWAVTEADYRMIHGIWRVECEKMVETGTLIRHEGHVHSWVKDETLCIVWSGIHSSRKALPILLHALARLDSDQRERIRVDILGEGPETGEWKSLSRSLKVDGNLIWRGRLDHESALAVMNSGHLFAFPSIKEGTPHVVLEALSLGLPVICHDACGMGLIVTNECGIKIPLKDPKTSVMGFAGAIRRLIDSPELISCLSAGCLLRAKELTWTEKARVIAKGYEEVV